MYTPIELDKVRNLRYGMKAFHLIEQKLNTKISKIDFDELSFHEQAVLIWAGLAHEDSSLSVDSVMDLIDQYSSIGEAIELSGKAISAAFGKSDGSGKTAAANLK
jgi:hypothetical protein